MRTMGPISDDEKIYIGRPQSNTGEHFGNPFSPLHVSKASVKVDSRDKAIENFEKWIRGEAFQNIEPERRAWILKHLDELEGKHLVCWCAPHKCHGDIYLQLLAERKKKK